METGFTIETIKKVNDRMRQFTDDYYRITESWREAYHQVGKFNMPEEFYRQCRD